MANTIVLCENNQSMEDENNDLEDGEIEDDDDDVIIESEIPPKDSTNPPKSEAKNDNKKETVNSEGIVSVDLSKNDKDKDKDSRSSRRERRAERADRHKSRKRNSAEAEDDWAGNVEKAIASIIKKEKKSGKTDDELSEEDESSDEKRRGKKRRRREKERRKKRRKSVEEKVPDILPPRYPSPPEDEIDEDEMLCIRGGSPKPVAAPLPLVPPPIIMSPLPFPEDGPFGPNQFDMYDSGSSEYDSDYQDRKRSFERDRDRKRDRDKKREGSRRDRKSKSDKNRERRPEKNRPVLQDSNSICLFYMQGKCHKGEECQYSHAAMPPMKLELCKFYLMDCCAKRDKCLYMHSEFPCKYYHTGLRCVQGERGQCKFAHGGPLNENLKQVLLKHLESAPKEILGDFPRLSREGAHSLVNATQKKLNHEYNNDGNNTSSSTSGIPSLFDINVSIPKELVSNLNDQENKCNDNNHKGTTKSPRSRPSRWGSEKEQVDVSQLVAQMNQQQSNYNNVPQSVFDNLNAQDQQKIQMYNMSFKFPGFYSDKGDQDMRIVSNGDVDMRALPPTLPKPINVDSDSQNNDTDHTNPPSPETHSENKIRDNVEKTEEEKALTDQDMRLLPTLLPAPLPTVTNENSSPSTMKNYVQAENHAESDNGLEEERDLEIDEPPEDESLKIDMNDDDEPENSPIKQEKNETDDLPSNLPLKQRELFMRIKAQQKENLFKEEKNESDDDIGQDENWYSDEDDEENSAPLSNVLKNLGNKDNNETKKSEQKNLKDVDLRPAEIKPGVIEPLTLQSGSNLMNKLSELSKVDISAEVTKLLSLVKNQANQSLQQSTNSTTNSSTTTTTTPLLDPRSQSSQDPRDPRHRGSSNTENKATDSKTTSSSSSTVNSDPRMKRKTSSDSRESTTKIIPKISIYELGTIDRSTSPTENRQDTDLRNLSDVRMRDSDLRVSNYGDTDLRPGGRSDVDLRQLNLPFKPIENYVPATEIEASISSHPPIPYRVHVCYIPRPDYSGLKLSAKDAQSSADPRIRKIFRLSTTPKVINEIASPEPSTPASPPSSQSTQSNPSILSPKSSDPRRADPRMQRKLSNTEPKDVSQPQQQQTTSNIPLEQMAMINGTNLDYNQQMQLLQNSTFYQGLNNNQKLILNQAISSQKSEQNSLQNDPILAAVLANLGLTNNPLNTNSILNPALGLMSLLNLSSNLNTPLVQPSLLGPGPTPLMANLGALGPSNDFNMGGFGVPGNQGTGLLGHSPYQNNMSGPPGNDFQFNNDQFFGGMEFGNNGGNKRNDRGYRGDRQNRRGRGGGGGGGNWNSGSGGRHGGNNRGNFQSRSARSNNRTNNRSRTPP
ncbi:protein suppressor of sable isoform X2 [Chrysoperla carnea]|uniref:protein suppressor of sable isoform X2 n=1 Tax=Chrysoperla carnea TaxID=189513 RepID=UPI001D085D96|nr:protein suppressor of sable isoform X2 [Chrysoperla carnea]